VPSLPLCLLSVLLQYQYAELVKKKGKKARRR
jgi:hypothetical protein